ncbi:MAG: peroxiredoxin-like family protein [Mariprofundaceae bacterium]
MSESLKQHALAEAITAFRAEMLPQIPEDALAVMGDATELLRRVGLADGTVKVGDVAPDFDLPELSGNRLSLSALLKDGPVVISFYRGAWCPYCNLEMQALQKALPDIEAAGGRLIAIAPETAEHAGETRDKGNLSFPLLQDRDNIVASAYGLVFTVPESLREVYQAFGIDLADSQGNDRFELPMPATYIVGTDGRVAHAFVDVDYTQRMEPADIVKQLKDIKR